MKGVIKSVSVMVMGSGAQLAANALAGFLATAWLPVPQRGLMILILSATAILALLCSAGLGNTFRARLPRLDEAGALDLRGAYATAAAIAVTAGVVVGVGVSISLQGIDSRMATIPVIAVVALATATQLATALLTDARFAGGRFSSGSRWSALGALAGVAGLALVNFICRMVGSEPTAVLMIAGQYGAISLIVIASLLFAIRSGDFRYARAPWSDVGVLVRSGIATMVLPLAIVIITRSDRLVLGAVTSASVVAVYGLAATYGEMLRIVPTAVAQLSTTRVARGGGLASISGLALLSIASTTVLAGGVVLVAWLVTVPLFGSEYAAAVPLTLLMVPGEILYAVIVLANLTLIGGQWSRVSVVIGGLTVPVAIALYWWGAVYGNAEGLAIGRNITFLIMAIAVSVAVCVCFARARRPAEVSALEPGSQGPRNEEESSR